MRLIDADALRDKLQAEIDKAIPPFDEIPPYDDVIVSIRCGVRLARNIVENEPTVDAVPVIRCKDCKYFDLDHVENVSGIPLIVAHEICMLWGEGCRTKSDGYCAFGERKEEP